MSLIVKMSRISCFASLRSLAISKQILGQFKCPASINSFSTSTKSYTATVTQLAPNFKGQAVFNGEFKELSLSDFIGKYLVLFFYPLDFTFVCPTEIIAYSNKAAEFNALNCNVIGVSTDSHFSHLAWINTPKKVCLIHCLNLLRL